MFEVQVHGNIRAATLFNLQRNNVVFQVETRNVIRNVAIEKKHILYTFIVTKVSFSKYLTKPAT